MKKGEVWLADFPFEDDKSQSKFRPVVVMENAIITVLSVKVTTHAPRDEYDVEIKYWEDAHLRRPSVARVSKVVHLLREDFIEPIGELHPEDMKRIEMAYAYYLNEQ